MVSCGTMSNFFPIERQRLIAKPEKWIVTSKACNCYGRLGLMLKLKFQLATWCEELTHLKRPWCWERLKAGGEGDDTGWNSWMASPTQWTWVWVDSGSWWWTGKPGVLQFVGLQRVRHDWTTDSLSLRQIESDLGTPSKSQHLGADKKKTSSFMPQSFFLLLASTVKFQIVCKCNANQRTSSLVMCSFTHFPFKISSSVCGPAFQSRVAF